ncbi:MAG: hypothetical protein HY897_01060 [Deltaproteobacteria bacterium]|nr:hypothetical protein [Deltaproteobacteria bacterium]
MTISLVAALTGAARAEKSNQIRPTPSPLTTTRIEPWGLTVTPRFIFTSYSDELTIPDLPGQVQKYQIYSTGVAVEAQLGVARWASVELGLEGYQKLGSITGPSPGDPTQLAEAEITGNAFKFAFQGQVRFFKWEREESAEGNLARPGDFAFYLFARGIGDFFSQKQYEPLFHTDFQENSIEYRTGLVGQVHLLKGVYLIGFGGIDGVWFTGSRRDTTETEEEIVNLGGSELPYPFFGFDILWSPSSVFESSVNDALSLGAILAMTREDEQGFGGNVWTINLSYTFRFSFGPESKSAPPSGPAPPSPPAN